MREPAVLRYVGWHFLVKPVTFWGVTALGARLIWDAHTGLVVFACGMAFAWAVNVLCLIYLAGRGRR